MKLFIISGEKSGDLHGADLARSFFSKNSTLQISGWGSDHMAAVGVNITRDTKDLGYIGLWEILKHLLDIKKQFSDCKNEITSFQPDAVICIDYPGFNLRMSRWCSSQNIPVYYYISPQVWAWKAGRVRVLDQYSEKIFCILPFEPEFYRAKNVHKAEYVGHPLLSSIPFPKAIENTSAILRVALLPGSRKSELERMIPVFKKLIQLRPDYQYEVAALSTLSDHLYSELSDLRQVSMTIDDSRSVIKRADAAVVTSGTATLETALLGCPQVAAYKVHPMTYKIGRQLTSIAYFSLVNLIVDRPLIQERLQGECNAEQLAVDLDRLLHDSAYTASILDGYQELRGVLGTHSPSDTISNYILNAHMS